MRIPEFRRKGAKFDKEKCLHCKYHTEQYRGYTVKRGCRFVNVSCNYASATGSTCLKRKDNSSVVDMRGNDYNNCMLYEEGPMILAKKKHITFN